MRRSETFNEITKAMAKFQAEVKHPKKSKDNPFHKSKYVPLEDVVEVIVETAKENGLSFIQWATNDEQGRVGVATIVNHSSGEWMEFPAIYLDMEKKTAQAAGSAITYARRYALSAIFGITPDDDDDANEASGLSEKKQNKSTAKETKPADEVDEKELLKMYCLAFGIKKETYDEEKFKTFIAEQSKTYSKKQILFYLNKKAQNNVVLETNPNN